MSYIGNQPPDIGAYDVESFDGGGTSFTLKRSATVSSVLLFIDGVRQTPTDAYTVSGVTLTTTGTTPSGTDNVTVMFMGDVVDIGAPSSDTITSAMIVDGAIVNDDINASAAIALSKLATDPSNASNLASGTVPTARLGSGTADATTFLRGDQSYAVPSDNGKILQVVSAGTATYAGSSTAVYVDTGLTVTITPASTSNKILILGTQADCYSSSGNTNNSIHIRLVRDSTEILDVCDRALYTGSALEQMQNVSFNYLDSPSLDVAITYKTQFHNQGAYANVAVQQQNAGRSTITVMEIEA